MKNNPVCKENASNVFRKEREQYHEIQDLKAQMQDKNMVINELKKLILVTKGKVLETQFDKPYVVRQPNAQRIPKPSVLGKPTPFSNSPEMRSFSIKIDGMFRIASTTAQNRTPQLPHASRNTNPHMSKSSGVIHTTSVYDQQLKSYKSEEKSNTRTSNANAVLLQECEPCVFNLIMKLVYSSILEDLNAKLKSLMHPIVPYSIVALILLQDVQLILFIVDSGCTKHMTGNLKLLCNFVEKFMGTVCFGNDQFAPILGYGDLIQGNVTIKREIYLFCERSSGKRFTNCKAKRSSFKTKAVASSQVKAEFASHGLVGPMRDENTRSSQRLSHEDSTHLPSSSYTVRTDRRQEYFNHTLYAYFKEEGIELQTYHSSNTLKLTEQKRRCPKDGTKLLFEAARTMLPSF
ncbi:hypothetical protein Tco_1273824 [Tanacetum coccineum]